MMDIEKEVKKTIDEYDLIKPNDKVAVALSGGKDSTTVLYILNRLGYKPCALLIDLGLGEWSKKHNEKMTSFCKKESIPLRIIDLKEELGMGICFIKSVLKKQKNLTGCSVCGTVKRWILNKHAKEINADKLVTGHNLDDEAQNVIMNFLKGNILLGSNSSPSTGNKDTKGFVQRIKPLFFIPESEILSYSKNKGFDICYEKCPCAFGTYRVETRKHTKNLSSSEKRNIVRGFQEIIPKIKNKKRSELRTCAVCKEPSSKEICNFCNIMSCAK